MPGCSQSSRRSRRSLTAALSTLAEAVTVQRTAGSLIYANEAAARMLGFDTPQELLATPIAQLVGAFETTNEDGSPLRMDDLPGRQVLAGRTPVPLVTHTISKSTGEESWRVTKASGVHDRDGNVKLVAVLLREHDGRATAEIVCAGHPLPLLARDGDARPVGDFSPMLGAYEVERWSRTTVDVAPGDVLVLYTDGVFDTVGADGRFGEERLQQTVAGVGDAVDAVARIDEALSRFEVGEQADDTAVLAVQRAVVPAAIGGSRAGARKNEPER